MFYFEFSGGVPDALKQLNVDKNITATGTCDEFTS